CGEQRAVSNRSSGLLACPELPVDIRSKIPVDQHVQHLHVPGRAVAPRVTGAPLDDYIARLELYLSFVEHQGDLSFEHDRVVHRVRAMHHRMAAALAESRRLSSAALAEELLRVGRGEPAGFFRLRRNDGNTKDRASRRRMQGAWTRGRLGS